MADFSAEINKLKGAGFSPQEIQEHYVKKLTGAGFKSQEINQFLTENKIGAPSLSFGSNPLKPTAQADVSSYIEENSGANLALKTLPALGATAATLLGPAGIVASPLMATAGGAGGSLLEGLIRRNTGMGGPQTPTERMTGPLIEGAKQGAAELAFHPLGVLASKMLAPNAAKLAGNPEAQSLLSYTKQNKLPMSPSTILPSKLSSAVEGGINMLPTGKAVTSKYQDRLYQFLLDSRRKVLEELTGAGKTESGKLAGAVSEKRGELKTGVRGSYGEIVPEIIKGGGTIALPQTTAYLDSLLQAPAIAKNKRMAGMIEDFKERLLPGQQAMSAQNFDSWQATIGNAAKTLKNNPNLGQDIWKVINGEVEAFDKTGGTALLDAINKAKMDNTTMAKYRTLSGFFEKATTIGQGGQEIFSAGRFYTTIMNERNQATLIRNFGKEGYENLKDYATMALKISEEAGKKGMSPIAKIWQTGLLGGLGAAAVFKPSLVVPYGMSYVAAHMVMKPRGIFKRWLTEGLSLSRPVKETLKIGGRAAIAATDEE